MILKLAPSRLLVEILISDWLLKFLFRNSGFIMKLQGRLYSSVDDSPLPDVLGNLSKNGHFWSLLDISPYIPIFKTVKSKLHELSSIGHLNTLAPPYGQNSRNCESDDTVKGWGILINRIDAQNKASSSIYFISRSFQGQLRWPESGHLRVWGANSYNPKEFKPTRNIVCSAEIQMELVRFKIYFDLYTHEFRVGSN